MVQKKINKIYFTLNNCKVWSQCSEICGILHSSMPIVIQCITLEKFLTYLWEK